MQDILNEIFFQSLIFQMHSLLLGGIHLVRKQAGWEGCFQNGYTVKASL